MALSETDLQDILSGLTPEEQKQLFERLGKTFGNDGGTAPEPQPRPHKNVKDGSSKVYCCIYCGSASYKGHGTNSKGRQVILIFRIKQYPSLNWLGYSYALH